MQRGQATATCLPQVHEKLPYPLGRHVSNREPVYGSTRLAGYERDKQAECIAVTLLSVSRQVSFVYQMLQQELTHPGTKLRLVSHGTPPEKHIVQSVPTLPATSRRSSSDTTAWKRCRCGPCRWTIEGGVSEHRLLLDTRRSVGAWQRCVSDRACEADRLSCQREPHQLISDN